MNGSEGAGEGDSNDALLVIDVINDFDHDDGARLLESFRERIAAMEAAIDQARTAGLPVIYANDDAGRWDSDAPGLVRSAITQGRGGEMVARLAPCEGDRIVLKPRYSAFDSTPLALLLEELDAGRLLLLGAATEGCIVQTAIDARELGFKVTILADACATNDEKLEQIALHYAEQVVGVRIARGATDESRPGRAADGSELLTDA